MADGATPTRLQFDAQAEIVIQKGESTIALHADGSIEVNGEQVSGPNAAAPAQTPGATTEEKAAETPQPDPAAEAKAREIEKRKELEARKKEAADKARREAIEAGLSTDDIMRAAEEAAAAVTPPEGADDFIAAPAGPAPGAEVPQAQNQDGMKIGQTVEGKGVFIGAWEPKASNGRPLGKKFNVFAAPEDLTGDDDEKILLTFNEAARRMSELKDWNGHDGAHFKNGDDLFNALRKDKYEGQWIIPPLDLIAQDNGDGITKTGLLFYAMNTGDLKFTFEVLEGYPASQWYWTITELAESNKFVHYIKLSENVEGSRISSFGRDKNRLAVRPIRLEPQA